MCEQMPNRDRIDPRRPTTLIIAALALCPVLLSCGRAAPAGDRSNLGAEHVIPAVEVVQVRHGALPLSERLTGTVRASGEVAIFPQTSGSVVEVFAQNGSAVGKNDPLVRIRTPGSEPQLAQARSNLELARAQVKEAAATLKELEVKYERASVLGERGIVSVEAVHTLRAQRDTARAAFEAAQARAGAARAAVAERSEVQGQLIVRAPISGRVGQRNVEVGMQVDPQTALFVIGRLDSVRVEVPVTQEILARVRKGQRVEVRPGDSRESITARVTRISPFLAAGSYSAEVEIDLPNESGTLVPGMFVTVDIFYGESSQATLVPTSALYEHPATGRAGVFVMTEQPAPATDGQVTAGTNSDGNAGPQPIPFRPVTIIAEGPQTIGLSGVQPGEWVVVVGQHLLSAQGGPEPPIARVRVIAWERILELQGLQRQDLLRRFMEKQQRLASDATASPPARAGGS
jgi:RND family efflux transporter MFP subunit